MNHSVIDKFIEETRNVNGWMSKHDIAFFHLLLTLQADKDVKGDLLEIGVFEGKSAIFLGRYLGEGEQFHVCDIFDEPTDPENSQEISASYPNFSRHIFESNMRNFLGFLPEIHQCPSSALPSRLGDRKFRFLHVDGSHLYPYVSVDLEYSRTVIIPDNGFIAVDDFRAQHTVGVAAAVWETIVKGKLVPLAITPAKMYLGKPGTSIDINKLSIDLAVLGIPSVVEEFLGFTILRTIGLPDEALYARKGGIASYIPPILATAIRNSYLWKKFRNR